MRLEVEYEINDGGSPLIDPKTFTLGDTDLTADDLNGLVSWPEGSNGEKQEKTVLRMLILEGNQIGYGRLRQLATILYEIAVCSDPLTMVEKYENEMIEFKKTVFKYENEMIEFKKTE